MRDEVEEVRIAATRYGRLPRPHPNFKIVRMDTPIDSDLQRSYNSRIFECLRTLT